MSEILIGRVKEIFKQNFDEPAFIVRSPARINLIGEHLDYNLGFVLPAAIDKAIYVAIRKREDREINLVAGDLEETFHATLDSMVYTERGWPNYLLGVTDQLLKMGHTLNGFDVVVMGDVPLGAGLSSSAAVECAMAFALNTLFDLGLDKKAMVQLSQKAENEFVGLQCGIMDMFASMFGKKEQVIQLDCRSLDYAYMPFDTGNIDIVLFDTRVKHSLASSEYNLRRQECEQGVAIIQQKYPEVKSLRDADMSMVNECLLSGNQILFNRCKYIVEEIKRLQDGCVDLQQHNQAAFGQKMFATHDGLSKLYAVSCAEADALVDMVRNNPSVLGARMMGGGFGGCTINLIQKEKTGALIDEVSEKYLAQFERVLKTYTVTIDDGTSLV